MPPPAKDAVCPEKRLLVCSARTKISPAIAEHIRELVAHSLDWSYLLSEAAENSITPLFERALRAAAPSAIPPEYSTQLKAALRGNTVRCLFLTAELNGILALFQAADIHAIPYKGPVAAAQAYGDITLREFEDLDIILRQRDLPKAHEIIVSLGYQPKFPWILSPGAAAALVPGEYNYRDDARRAMVELHTEITLRHFPVVPDLDDFLHRLVPVDLSGHAIQTFRVEDALPILCIHGSKDFWERISWIADISELVQSHPALDWDQAERRTESLKAQRMLHLGLTLAADLLDAPLPPDVLSHIRADAAAATIAKEVQHRLLSRELPALDAKGRLNFRRRMVPGVMAGWRYAARLAVVPAEEDWQMMRLPAPLAPLYIALRPLRLLRKYGWAGRRSPRLSS
ncbi:MAG: nucleotidyltransferase family protein [Candidatus Acidiferrales bacterium]